MRPEVDLSISGTSSAASSSIPSGQQPSNHGRRRQRNRRRNNRGNTRRQQNNIHALETLRIDTENGENQVQRREGAGFNRGGGNVRGGRGRRGRRGQWRRLNGSGRDGRSNVAGDRARVAGCSDGNGNVRCSDLEKELEHDIIKQAVRVNRMRIENSGISNLNSYGGGEPTELASDLTEKLLSGKVECTVCLENIKVGKKIWSCNICYIILHYHCITKWAHAAEQGGTSFRCPGCQGLHQLVGRNQNIVACRCFCGKVRDPPQIPGVTIGACDDICLRSRGGGTCPHSCPLRCHPGPCPKCTLVFTVPCFCGKTEIPRKCGEILSALTEGCGKPCGSIHKRCGHSCSDLCHPGACRPCDTPVQVTCFCGKSKIEVPCHMAKLSGSAEGRFSCENTCERLQDCGIHGCKRKCHDDPCVCPRSVEKVKTCCCGRRNLTLEEKRSRHSCQDSLISCGSVCGKFSGCPLKHNCTRICGDHEHNGSCSLSGQKSESVACRCGRTVVAPLSCDESVEELRSKVLCTKKCNQKKSCGRHRCEVECCPFRNSGRQRMNGNVNLNIAKELWSDTAGIPTHSCHEVCDNQLNCTVHRCDLPCGHIGNCPPCGRLVHNASCACGAEVSSTPIRCGEGPPLCLRRCQRVRACGHPCYQTCHTSACPPCVVRVERECIGGHGQRSIVPCCITEVSCGKACGKALACGVHTCRTRCHPQEYGCESQNFALGRCTQQCGLPLSRCSHPCPVSCHGKQPCPESQCNVKIVAVCSCGRRRMEKPCHACKDPRSGGYGEVECDDECRRQERLRGFATAVGKDEGEESADLRPEPAKYPQALLQFAADEPSIVEYVESEFGKIADGRMRKAVFNDFPSECRHMVHTLAEHYNLDTESSGRPVYRKLVARHKGVDNRPAVPQPLLSEASRRWMQERLVARTRRRLWFMRSEKAGMDSVFFKRSFLPKLLRPHLGSYRLVESAAETAKDGAVLVEFSTPERMIAAKASLQERLEIVVREHQS